LAIDAVYFGAAYFVYQKLLIQGDPKTQNAARLRKPEESPMRVSAFASYSFAFTVAFATAASDAKADTAAGEVSFKRACAACHNATAEGPRKMGPTMHAIVDRTVASIEGFKYSNAKRTSDMKWSPENLDRYLANPREFMPGTTMAYAGMKNDAERANLIAYLKTLK
jgi:cytochrome c